MNEMYETLVWSETVSVLWQLMIVILISPRSVAHSFIPVFTLQGLSRDKDKRDNVKNSFWVYEINKDKW